MPSAAACHRTHRGTSCSQRPSTEKMQTPRNAREGKCRLPAVPHGERAGGNPSQIFHASQVLKGLQRFRAQLDSESSRSSVGGQWFYNVHKLGRNSEFIPGPSHASKHLSSKLVCEWSSNPAEWRRRQTQANLSCSPGHVPTRSQRTPHVHLGKGKIGGQCEQTLYLLA